ncbi:MAG: sensor histidine kinase [Candidatus Dormibacteria bacterium]
MAWRPSIRLRLAAAATVTAVFALALVSLTATTLVESALTGDLDSRIARRTTAVVTELSESASAEVPGEVLDPEYREPLLVWHFSPSGAPLAVGDLGPSAGPNLPASVRRNPGIATVLVSGTRFRVRTTSLVDGSTATIGASLASVDHTTAALRLVESLLGIPLVMLVFGGAYLLARAALQPVENLRRAAEMVGRGASSARPGPVRPSDEIGRLAATFDHMIDRLDRVRSRQDQISADASHELRTPLAAIEAEASLALRHKRTPDEYRDSLQLVVQESRRMAAVLDGLLWLTRADGGESAPASELQDLAAVGRQAIRRFEPIARDRGLELEATIPDHPLPISAPAHWLDRLLDVLLDNACKYSPPHGKVGLRISEDRNLLNLLVTDDGPGIPASEHQRLRQRYQRGDGLGSGTGLGLAIAEAVARATDGELLIEDGDLGGAAVSIRWPSDR